MIVGVLGRRFQPIAAALLAVAACDSSTGPSFPEVAGTYTGPLTVGATFQGETVPVNGSMRVLAEQDGNQATLSGSTTILGETEPFEPGAGIIDEAGVWTDAGSEFFELGDDQECPGYTGRRAVTVRFSGGSLRVESSVTHSEPTVDCPSITLSAALTRT